MKTRHKITILTICYLISCSLVIYPFVSTIYNNYLESLRVVDYESSVSTIDEDQYQDMLDQARAWNQNLYSEVYANPDSSYLIDDDSADELYESLLNLKGDGMMGYIVIPKIDVSIGIYHYVTDETLELGAGHMQKSSLPVGGENTHCVISAHRGLPSATMFTDLDQLQEGDIFYLKILNEILTYEVTNIQVVEPDETDALVPVEHMDLCTLVTCTPYGINTHRLLVTGTRIETEDTDEETVLLTSSESQVKADNEILVLIAVFETLCYTGIVCYMKKQGRRLVQREDST